MRSMRPVVIELFFRHPLSRTYFLMSPGKVRWPLDKSHVPYRIVNWWLEWLTAGGQLVNWCTNLRKRKLVDLVVVEEMPDGSKSCWNLCAVIGTVNYITGGGTTGSGDNTNGGSGGNGVCHDYQISN